MVKEKQVRTYDGDGFRKRAACLCVRDAQEHEILLVTSSRMTDHWIVPGGGVEPNENPSEAAIRETEEEAGVRGVIKRRLGDFEVRDENKGVKHRTSVFVLEVNEELDEWEDCKSRLRRWFPLEEALAKLASHKPVQCTYINWMIQTSPTLRHSAPHLLSLVASHLNVTPDTSSIFPPGDAVPPTLPACKSSPPADTTPSLYLQVNHYPSEATKTNNSGTSANANFHHAFICSRDVYSTDSETADDGAGLIEPPNHFNANAPACEAENGAKKSELLPMAESSVNS